MINIDEEVTMNIANKMMEGDYQQDIFDDAVKNVLILMEKDSFFEVYEK